MGKGYKHGGSGGAALNFNVKAYPSETELKAAKPRENTLGVITTTTMTSWVFFATEPKEPEVGMVWISEGISSPAEFNALKKDTLQVYPNRVMQYVNGAFAFVDAYIWQNGEWKSIRYAVIKDGEYLNNGFNLEVMSGEPVTDVGVRTDGTGRNFFKTGKASSALVLCTEDKIPKNVNSLTIVANMLNGYFINPGSYNEFFVSTYNKWPDSFNNKLATVSPFTGVSTQSITAKLDLSSVTEDAYLWVACSMGTGKDVSITIKDIIEG